jgi:hypothetical protein
LEWLKVEVCSSLFKFVQVPTLTGKELLEAVTFTLGEKDLEKAAI